MTKTVFVRLIRDRDMDVVAVEVYTTKEAAERSGYDDFYTTTEEYGVME
jgi:ABC-type uncharacterized transport system auxiliary subunit